MDMDMDVAWCLTCSKQTRDPRSPYCSEACRDQDANSNVNPNGLIPLTSPVPPGLIPSPTKATSPSGHPTPRANNSPVRRPSIGPLAPLPTSFRSKPSVRDRRAFSFPATNSVAPIPIKMNNSRRPTQTIETLQFARRTNPISVNMTASPSHTGLSAPRMKGFDKLSKTTGSNTPVISDSAFCSTSESSDNEAVDIGDVSPMKMPKALTPLDTTVRPSVTKRSGVSNAFMAAPLFGQPPTSSPLPAARPGFISRKSPSPVAAMIASSASSKSRDDIVSWLNEVKRLPPKDEDGRDPSVQSFEGSYQPRGRSRTRREVLANLPPPSQASLDEHDGENGLLGTTPKGRIGSAFAGLTSFGGFGVGPIVKALTSVTSTTSVQSPSTANSSTGLGLQSVPLPTEVSRVPVTVAATAPSETESHLYLQMGGTTPTLSTISVSELVDPLTDNGDHIDFMTSTDDQSATGSSSFARRRLSAYAPGKATTLVSNQGIHAPAKPITSTASAIWNLSTYLRSFAPFSISSVVPSPIPNRTPIAQVNNTKTHLSPRPQLPQYVELPVSAPVPAARPAVPAEAESPAQQMVRSLPMDIVLPVGGENPHMDRIRQREIREWIGTPSSTSHSRSQTQSRRRDKSRTGYDSRSASHSHSRHGRKISYDADASGEEDGNGEVERRGRSRREKGLPGQSHSRSRRGSDAKIEASEDERGRDRGRDRERTVRV
ncbi:uncharacterized protein IL334_000599 [Kwoniella shivajii]|uniref:Uncharacterized protein n=1 Tax=Kwoniella shivajii TaxID=564305 RepID=A0ABZ1CPU8_9TREE|nr:hypothetical protein IL334_000599 [Kwoniella shivajii]